MTDFLFLLIGGGTALAIALDLIGSRITEEKPRRTRR
jgi:hypothetical protein